MRDPGHFRLETGTSAIPFPSCSPTRMSAIVALFITFPQHRISPSPSSAFSKCSTDRAIKPHHIHGHPPPPTTRLLCRRRGLRTRLRDGCARTRRGSPLRQCGACSGGRGRPCLRDPASSSSADARGPLCGRNSSSLEMREGREGDMLAVGMVAKTKSGREKVAISSQKGIKHNDAGGNAWHGTKANILGYWWICAHTHPPQTLYTQNAPCKRIHA